MSLVGFFCLLACALPSGQIRIDGVPTDHGASLVHLNGAVIGRYIDDTYPGNPRTLAAYFRSEHVGLILVGSYGRQEYFGPGTTDVVEDYPVLDATDKITSVPYIWPYESGYVLQDFSWGNNMYDATHAGRCAITDPLAVCAKRYSAPSATQMKRMWCLAQQNRPAIVLWYYYSAANVHTILTIERSDCDLW